MSFYLVDTNFFIQSHRGSYPLDVVLSYWSKVKQLANERKIFSIDKVKKEIYKNDDSLKKWYEENLPKDFFIDSTSIDGFYIRIVNWAVSKSNHYLPKAIAEFLDADEADAWIISYALANVDNLIIVTQEISEPLRKNKIKIPDVCVEFGVKFTNTIGMFRSLGMTF
ncbi:MAG: twitching motility protein PilT [Ignavibacteria bacterium]|nr:twitching motility protein PilT [Ignavibacteria bacterium]